MDARFRSIAALAAEQHSVVSLTQLANAGVTPSMRSRWVEHERLVRLGPRSFLIGGSERTWLSELTAAVADHDGHCFIAGRSAGRMMALDDFVGADVELLTPRATRGRARPGVRSTRMPIPSTDVQRIAGLPVVRAERLIIDAPLFDFTRAETENAIDSAIRRRLVSEQRLRTRVIAEHRPGVNGSRLLLDALVDTGGESRLERWFLQLCRDHRLTRPSTQRVFRDGSRTIARVDCCFPGNLVVEVAGHGTHATRRQRQVDAQRHTELTLLGTRVLTFTYEDVRDRSGWVAATIARALRVAA
ncbi:MAG: hypothetical protein RL238_2874 [Actinomycetota bacterium]|jgi:very-short-patch-repair endonuclease